MRVGGCNYQTVAVNNVRRIVNTNIIMSVILIEFWRVEVGLNVDVVVRDRRMTSNISIIVSLKFMREIPVVWRLRLCRVVQRVRINDIVLFRGIRRILVIVLVLRTILANLLIIIIYINVRRIIDISSSSSSVL